MSLLTIPRRLGASLVIVIGIGGVVCVMMSLFAMAIGFTNAIAQSGRTDRVIIIASGARSEVSSNLTRGDVAAILDLRAIKRDQNGRPIAAAEVLRFVSLRKRINQVLIKVSLRGLSPEGLRAYPEIKIVEGRLFKSAVRELVVGRNAQHQFDGLAVGDRLQFAGGEWTIVGAFVSDGDTHESEIMGDVQTIQSAFQSSAFQGVSVLLNSPDDIGRLNAELANRPGLPVAAWIERDYFATQSRILGNTLFAIGFSVGTIMSLGAVFGALNTMYSAISTRSLEIATLRAIGFTGFSVAVSVLIEAMLLAIVGAILGCLTSWLILHSQTISMLNGGGTQVVFAAVFNPKLALAGAILALFIGFIGGLAPAVRAATLPVSIILRTS